MYSLLLGGQLPTPAIHHDSGVTTWTPNTNMARGHKVLAEVVNPIKLTTPVLKYLFRNPRLAPAMGVDVDY